MIKTTGAYSQVICEKEDIEKRLQNVKATFEQITFQENKIKKNQVKCCKYPISNKIRN